MFITAEEIRNRTSFEEVMDLTDDQIQGYMDRADSWIRRATEREFDDSAAESVKRDMGIATFLLVEYLWFWDHPEIKEETMSGDEIIKLGTFSVNKREKAHLGDATGIKELDDILEYYKYRPKIGSVFRVLRKD